MNIAIYGMKFTKQSLDYLQQILVEIERRGWKALLEKDVRDHLRNKYSFDPKVNTYNDFTDFKSGIDLMIGLGGDGSFLRAVRFIRDSGVPIVGINTGRLGFLSNISKESISETFFLIEAKKYDFQKILDSRCNTR